MDGRSYPPLTAEESRLYTELDAWVKQATGGTATTVDLVVAGRLVKMCPDGVDAIGWLKGHCSGVKGPKIDGVAVTHGCDRAAGAAKCEAVGALGGKCACGGYFIPVVPNSE